MALGTILYFLFEYCVKHMCQSVTTVDQLSLESRREVVYELI